MTYFLFLYSIVLTLIFGACGFGFLILFIKRKRTRDLWIAIVFLLFVYDNLKFSMAEIIPGFAEFYNNLRTVENIPVLIFSYFFTSIYLFKLSFTKWEKLFIISIAVVLLITTPSYTIHGRLIFRFVKIIFHIYIFIKSFLSLKKRRPEINNTSYMFYRIFLFSCTAAQLIGSIQCISLILSGRHERDFRIIGHELFGIFCACAAIWYLIKILSRADESKLSGEELVSLFCRHYKLSARESDLIPMLLDGMQNAEISDRLCISLSTVKAHVHNIYRKIGIERRTQLLAKYQEFTALRNYGESI